TDISQAIRMIGETPFLEFKEEGPVAPVREPTQEELQALAEWNKAARERAYVALARARAGEDFTALVAELSEESAKEIGGDIGFIGRAGGFESVAIRLARIGAREGTILREVVEIDVGYGVYRVKETRKNPETGATEYRVERIFFPKKSIGDIIPSSPWRATGLGGKQLESASVIFDPTTGEPQVSLNFNSEGKALFAEITTRNVGKLLAIFLDGQPISIPRVSEPITGGSAIVSGTFDIREAKLLAQRLNAGALPVPITLVSQQTVGASLGKSSLDRSLFAGLIGFAIVALFMVLYYRLPGLLAVGALVSYATLLLALFKFIPVTLTLAGIAGFILSIGMAVDANVLIFERLKEELRLKKTIGLAVDEAFRRAWPSIRDGNLTTLLSCAVLFWFSESLVRGFALTLGIGVLVSMFSAISVTRVFLKMIAPHVGRLWWYRVHVESENVERST
ncbi:MAG: protein translocase subunit SecD, partial [Patescibacteria group bacterium]